MRIPFATSLKSRDGTLDQDAKVVNGIVEPEGDAAPTVRRRPGLTDLGLVRAGAAQLLYYWYSKVRTVIGDYISDVSNATVDTPTWSSVTLSQSATWLYTAYTGTKFVMVSRDGSAVEYSTDGTTWAAGTPDGFGTGSILAGALAAGGGTYVVVGTAASVRSTITSTNGTAWTKNATVIPAGCSNYALCYNSTDAVFMSCGDSGSATSVNGVTWVQKGNMPASQTWSDIVWADSLGLYVAVADAATNTIATSPDGATWTSRGNVGAAGFTGVAWNGSILVAVKYSQSYYYTSTDGINWASRTPPSSNINGIEADATTGIFIATTISSTSAYYSLDGITWTAATLSNAACGQTYSSGIAADGAGNLVVCGPAGTAGTRGVLGVNLSTDSAALSPTSPAEPFSAQDNGANSPNALLMIKNSSQAWTINTADTVTQITDVDYPGKYTVELESLTRSTTVATATAKTANNFIAGESVTIANVSNGTLWNGTFTIASVFPLDITEPLDAKRITLTRSSATATAQTYDGSAHNLETGDSVVISGALQDEYNGTFTVTVTSPTTFTFTVSITTTTTGAFTNLGVTSLTRSGTLAKAVCASPHGITSTATVTVDGANQPAYNGSYTVTKLTANEFTYAVTVTGAGYTTTGNVGPVTVTLAYDATTGRVTGTSTGAHGLANNSSITVTGATPNAFNGDQGPITVTSTTVFYYQLQGWVPESASSPDVSKVAIAVPANSSLYVFSRNAREAATSLSRPSSSAVLTVTMTTPAWATVGTMCGIWSGELFYWGTIYSAAAGSFTVDVGHMPAVFGPAGYTFGAAYVVEGYALTSVAQTAGAATATTSEAHGYTTGHLVIVAPYPWATTSETEQAGWHSAVYTHPVIGAAAVYAQEQTVTSGGASAIAWTMRYYSAATPASTAVTGTTTLASDGVQVYQPGAPAEIATGTITATSTGTAVTSPATPATGTIEVTRPGTVNASSFTFTVENDNTKYTTPATTASTITAFSGKTTVPGIAYLNGYFVVMDQAGVLYNSAIDNPATWEALEYTSALNEPGEGVAVVKTGSYVAALKEWSTEFFYDAANPTGSPLSPVENGFTLIGCADGWSLANVDGSTMWIAQSKKHKGRQVYRMIGTEQAPVSTPDVERVLNADSLATVYAWGARVDGHPCYVLSLVASDVTLAYDTVSQAWYQWTSLTLAASKSISSITRSGTTATVTFGAAHGLSDGDPLTISGATQTDYNGLFQVKYVSTTAVTIEVENSPTTPATGTILGYPYTESYLKWSHYTAADGVDVILHVSDGHLYEIDPDVAQDDGVPVNYFIRTARLDGGGSTLKKIGSVKVIGEKVSDTAMMRWSDDDSTTFTKYRDVDLSAKQPELRRCGSFRRRSFELRHVGNSIPRVSELELGEQ